MPTSKNLPKQFTVLQDWLAYLETLHPTVIDLGLARIKQVAQTLQLLPLPKFVITVAGTNGKGTSVALLESIFLSAGYKVGTYTSPHLIRYNERIKINGAAVTDAALCEAFIIIEQARGDTTLTYFEFGTLAALWLFNQVPLDVVILEVGLGGRLDAVNIVDPDIALITTIELDHVEYLGADRETIGMEKAGIMRKHKPVVCGDHHMPTSIQTQAEQTNAVLYTYAKAFNYEQINEKEWCWQNQAGQLTQLPVPKIPLQNAAAVLQVLTLLPPTLAIAKEAIVVGLRRVRVAGRFQVFNDKFTCILDVAHNPAAAKYLAEKLHAQPIKGRTLAVIGMLADKDQQATVKALASEITEWFVGGLQVPRGANAQMLAQALSRAGLIHVNTYNTVEEAYENATKQAHVEDRVIVLGSFHTVAQIMQLRL